MSAYIVDKNVICFLVHAAMSRSVVRGHTTFGWYHNGQYKNLGCTDWEKAVDAGNMLWLENIASVSARYPGESSDTLPGPCDHSGFVVTQKDLTHSAFDRIDPVQVLKTCDNYDYQSCEHDGWEKSEAHSFIEALRGCAIHALPGYEAAEWGAPKPRAGVIALSAMCVRTRR